MDTFLTRCAIAVALVAGVGAQTAKPSTPFSVVTQLYADFACETTTAGCNNGRELVDQPKAVLSRYFDDQLVRLWLADRACVARTGEICNLDFVPMWDSQDPSGTTIRIVPTESANVDVELRHPSSPAARVLRYSLVKTATGWRIHDISLAKEWSLVALLSQKI